MLVAHVELASLIFFLSLSWCVIEVLTTNKFRSENFGPSDLVFWLKAKKTRTTKMLKKKVFLSGQGLKKNVCVCLSLSLSFLGQHPLYHLLNRTFFFFFFGMGVKKV